ncbi:DUF1559 family PulG-like putative transporter [Bremerella cremea]|uniref:DUF1559 family PulG-like putative transporter n=1 Tax=Bremerella cremea TaxID=1031537 RepID=UPI00402B3008
MVRTKVDLFVCPSTPNGDREVQLSTGPQALRLRSYYDDCSAESDSSTIYNRMINVCNQQGLYSFHPAGAMIGLGDGSVRFLSETTDIEMLVAMHSRAGGEVFEMP